MLRRTTIFFALFLTGSALLLTGCDSTGSNKSEDGGGLGVHRVEDLPADPVTSSGGGRPSGTGKYTFYSLRDSSTVLSYDKSSRADSASTQWGIAFQSTNVILNGGDNGPGDGAAYLAEKPFEEVAEVDTDRFAKHSAGDWYNYNRETHVVTPKPGRTLVVRTANGNAYAKIRFVSYYEGAPDDPAESDAASRYYTFEYVIQTNGTSFK